MIELDLKYEDGNQRTLLQTLPVVIGRSAKCGLCIPHWRVARQHAQLIRGADGIYLQDFGSLAGTHVNGRRVSRFGPIKNNDAFVVGPCLIKIRTGTHPLNNQVEQHIETQRHLSASEKNLTTDITPSKSKDSIVQDGTSEFCLLGSRHLEIWQEVRISLTKAFDLRRCDTASLSDEALRQEAVACVSVLLEQYPDMGNDSARHVLLNAIVDEAVGFGILEELLSDPRITEIMVNRFDEIYVEIHGRLNRHFTGFSSPEAFRSVIDRIVFGMGRRIDEASPMVDARLNDGSRVNAVISPVALNGPFLTIRKFPANRLKMSDLLKFSSLNVKMSDLIELCITSRVNILVSGGTGSGKTTLLNILGSLICASQRIITIEDSAELQISHQHVISLEARAQNTEGQGRISIRDLVRNALRMRPDRIIVGEVRGPEALDMLIAMNTGHSGSMTTLHANTPRDALSRLETMVLMADLGLPLDAIRDQIASSVQIVLQQTRLSCGRRVISDIVEITGIDSGVIQMQRLMHFDSSTQCFVYSGIPPAFLENADHVEQVKINQWLALD